MAEERLQKYIAAAGLASRRTAEGWILAGRVQVNGKTVTRLGTRIDPGSDRVTVDGRPVRSAALHRYILLHKPRGVMCTLSDPEGRPVVTDLLHKVRERVFPVGRLDFNSEGLLLLTNDGDFALRVSHPRYGIRKVYRVKVRGPLEEKDRERILRGITVEGRRVAPAALRSAGGRKNPWYLLTLVEGRNREVRRLFEAAGRSVVRLVRVQIGPIRIGRMRPGQFRDLTPEEIRLLAPPRGGRSPRPGREAARPTPAALPRDDSEE